MTKDSDGMQIFAVEELYRLHSRVKEDVRASEQSAAQLSNALLLGNSFLVAAFAVMLGQQMQSIVHYSLASVGIALCLLLFLAINATYAMHAVQLSIMYKLRDEVQRISPAPDVVWEDLNSETRPLFGLLLLRIFSLPTIHKLWLPSLFLVMWIILLIFAID